MVVETVVLKDDAENFTQIVIVNLQVNMITSATPLPMQNFHHNAVCATSCIKVI